MIPKEDLEKLVVLAREIHSETRYSSIPFNEDSFTNLIGLTQQFPDQLFFTYHKDSEGSIISFFLGQLSPEYFSGNFVASDLGMFVKKELRGSTHFYRMLQEFQEWAKLHGAKKIILYHSTGIEPEKALEMFPRLGYTHYGYIFDKEI
jgi:GNAT superfamily N-acetyltransferase